LWAGPSWGKTFPSMTRKTGMLLLAALAISVAFLGLVLAARCERPDTPEEPEPQPATLTVRNDAGVG